MENLDIHPRVSVNPISSMNWTVEQDVEFAQAAGIGVLAVPFFKFAEDPAKGIDVMRQSGLRCSTLSAGAGSLIDSAGKTLEAFRPAIDAAATLGCTSLYSVSGPTPPRMPTDEAYARLVQCLGPAVEYAGSRNLRLGIEHSSIAMREHGFINSLADAVDLSRDTGAGICVELQNCWYERNLAELFRNNVDCFAVVQVSDFLVGEELRYNRRVPGDGSMPLEWLLQRLLDAGYEGYFDIEVIGPAIEAEGYESAIRRSVEWLSSRLTSWGV